MIPGAEERWSQVPYSSVSKGWTLPWYEEGKSHGWHFPVPETVMISLSQVPLSIASPQPICDPPTPRLRLAQGHAGHERLGMPVAPGCGRGTAPTARVAPAQRRKRKGKKSRVNKKKPICKYCKECMFSYVLLLSPFVSYQQTSCQLGEVPTYFFFPVKCFSMPERIKMNVNEVY